MDTSYSLFQTSWWLDAVAPGQWREANVEEDGQTLARGFSDGSGAFAFVGLDPGSVRLVAAHGEFSDSGYNPIASASLPLKLRVMVTFLCFLFYTQIEASGMKFIQFFLTPSYTSCGQRRCH